MSDTIEVHPPEHLMKYDPPIFIGFEASKEQVMNAVEMQKKSGKGKDSNSSQLEDMINSMLPPREWVEDSGAWMQYTSKDKVSRKDVQHLQEDLDRRLAERQAREAGLCHVRENLYQQVLDELIREITLESPERGLLLMRVRDEARMTIDAYKTLYSSSIVYGIKKQIQAESGIDELEADIANYKETNESLETKVAEMRGKLEMTEKRIAEKRAVEDRKRKEEIEFLKQQGQHLEAFMKSISGSK